MLLNGKNGTFAVISIFGGTFSAWMASRNCNGLVSHDVPSGLDELLDSSDDTVSCQIRHRGRLGKARGLKGRGWMSSMMR